MFSFFNSSFLLLNNMVLWCESFIPNFEILGPGSGSGNSNISGNSPQNVCTYMLIIIFQTFFFQDILKELPLFDRESSNDP